MEKKFKSFKTILIEAKSQRDILDKGGEVMKEVLTDIIFERNLADCAVWLKGAIAEVNMQIEDKKAKGEAHVCITGLKDMFEDHLNKISKIMIKEPEKI